MMPMEYMFYRSSTYQPGWMKSERFDYCDHVAHIRAHRASLQQSFRAMINKMTHR
ncbi:MAG: hypothetical protein HUJ70_03850 [Pseudobutyrivibrio sp.]|nr:hypothetical protein [Pseudobutyrivibrio sp.]